MVDRGAHIDLFFRNGLKEFEVLPPADVWDSIKPVIRKTQRSFYMMKVAAFSAIIVSLGAVSFLLTRSLSDKFAGTTISLNQETVPQGTYIPKSQPVTMVRQTAPAVISAVTLKDNINSSATHEESQPKLSSIRQFNPSFKEFPLRKKNINNPLGSSDINVEGSSSGSKINFVPEDPETVKPDKSAGRWSVGALASPTYYSRLNPGADATARDLTRSEKAAVSYSGGVAFSYTINKRISLQTGLYYSSLGQKVTGVSSFAGFRQFYDVKNGSDFSIQTSSGTITSYNNDIFLYDSKSGNRVQTMYTIDVFDPYKASLKYIDNSLHQNFNYLEVPLFLKYKVIDRKVDFNLIGGISYNILISNSAYSYSGGVKYYIGKTEGLSLVTISSSIGMGMEYSLSKKISLNVEPTFRYYLTPVGSLTGYSLHTYSFGILSGFSFKF